MASFMRRWIGLGTSTHTATTTTPVSSTPGNGKKRSHAVAESINNDENVEPAAKRPKRAFVDLSRGDSDDEIIVSHHRPLGELKSNHQTDLSEEDFTQKMKRKLYVKPVMPHPQDVAECSRPASEATRRIFAPSPAARQPATKSPARPVSGSLSSNTISVASSRRQKSNYISKPSMHASGFVDLRRGVSSKVSTLNILERPSSQAVELDIYDNATPPTHVAMSSASDEQSPRRGSRRNARKSYINMDLAESEDELSRPLVTSRKAKSRYQDDDDADFAANENDDAAVSEDYNELELELAQDLGETSVDEGCEDNEDEYDALRAKPAKASKASKASKAKPTGTSKDSKPTASSKGSRKRMVNLKSGNAEAKKINYTLPPMFETEDIFCNMTAKARKLGLDSVITGLDARPIRVATMCSGTESPLLALEMIADCLSKSDLHLKVEHLFSAEIVPFKQAYIERNFNPPVIFRDITELTSVVSNEEPMATTAYGGKVPVPKEVDVVIAGTSCVDFSGLNTYQKDLDAGGESADTWNAVLSYCRAFRPSIVLLENVSGADWDRMLTDYENIGYDCSGASVNTRDYYLPQIRERGYMACFNKKLKGYAPGSATRWLELMVKFKRPASSPVSDFLEPNDRITRQTIRSDAPTKEVDWRQCQITQMEYRQDMKLGWARPITNWSESGQMLPPDNGYAP